MIEIKADTSTIKCKNCGTTQVRVLAGRYPNNDKRWVDAEGNEFNGHTCPPCHKEKVRNRKQRKKRNGYL